MDESRTAEPGGAAARDAGPAPPPAMDRRQLVAVTVVFEGVLFGLAVGLGWLFGVPALGRLRFEAGAVLWGVAASLVMLAGLALAMRSRWPPFARLRELLDEVVKRLFANCTVVDLALISTLAGLGEEAFFRGFLQTALTGWLDPWAAVAVASAIFGVAHFVSLTYAVMAALIGVLFGWQLMVSDNLLLPIVTHGVYDFLALSYLVFVRRPHRAASVI